MVTLHFQRNNRLVSALLLLLIASISLLSQPLSQPEAQGPARVHPMLLQAAAITPDLPLQVIVQQLPGSPDLEALISSMGGEVISRLSIINALVAQLPSGALPLLGSNPSVRWISPDAPVQKQTCTSACTDSTKNKSAFVKTIGAERLWNEAPNWSASRPLKGRGITVAVVDSGIASHSDLGGDPANTSAYGNRVRAAVNFVSSETGSYSGKDPYGHGTHIAGTIGGNGYRSNGQYAGVAPEVSLIDVRVMDSRGQGKTSDVIAGLQWIYNNRNTYNIRVVNVSLSSGTAESYHVSPLDAALELLWFNKIVVVVSSGNYGTGVESKVNFPPANDPFVITVGAADDKYTASVSDDVLTRYSARGTTSDGFTKPDIVAPGVNIIAASPSDSKLIRDHSSHKINSYYFRMSGTSMASAVTTGAVALLLQSEPTLTPDQVKYRLIATGRPFFTGNAPYLSIYDAVHSKYSQSANTGIQASRLIKKNGNPMVWDSVNWSSVNWSSVNWSSVNWSSVNWSSVNWSN